MNLHQVSPTLYRSDQPNPAAWPILRAAFGPFSVLSLCHKNEIPEGYDPDVEDKASERYTMYWENVPMGDLPTDKPNMDTVESILKMLQSGGTWLVHCWRGDDRTGVIVACYRMRVQGWAKKDAIAEAVSCGMSSLQIEMHKFLNDFPEKG